MQIASWGFRDINNIGVNSPPGALLCDGRMGSLWLAAYMSIPLYRCEAWTIEEDLRKRIEAFEMWIFRRMLSISWTLKVSNEEVLRRVNQRRELLHTIKIRKVAYLGHVC
ncbi:jg10474 [Pararge aegeria aegeria]|uniref:Jg10474 protein n=1 Tax=Pararge aegeria aegeria TaxID=348720 RepID=A0A8S4REK4_9NEOP|nr:jg10474 [Pararge aegeria aegeria]